MNDSNPKIPTLSLSLGFGLIDLSFFYYRNKLNITKPGQNIPALTVQLRRVGHDDTVRIIQLFFSFKFIYILTI